MKITFSRRIATHDVIITYRYETLRQCFLTTEMTYGSAKNVRRILWNIEVTMVYQCLASARLKWSGEHRNK